MMNGKRLGRFALSPPLRHRRTLRPPITLLHQITSELSPRCLRPSSLGLKTGVSERTFYVGARHTSSERSSSLGAGHMARGRANRAYLAVGGMVAFLAVVLLAREGQLPESFAEWDDKVLTHSPPKQKYYSSFVSLRVVFRFRDACSTNKYGNINNIIYSRLALSQRKRSLASVRTKQSNSVSLYRPHTPL